MDIFNLKLPPLTSNKLASISYISAGHTCTFSGCKDVLVLDGNQKNQRSICMAKDAGYIEFSSISGSIKSGCINTPQYKSRFCEVHTPRACNAQPVHLNEAQLDTEEPRDYCNTQLRSDSAGEPVVQLLLEKKTTRHDTYYKVFHALTNHKFTNYTIIGILFHYYLVQ